MSNINQEERAFRAWNVLIEVAKNENTITYKQLGDELGVHHRTCRYFLDHIQNYCLDNKLPPLTILVNNQEGTVGNGFIAWDTDNLDEGMNQVYEHNWSAIHNPFTYAQGGDTAEDIVELIIQKDGKLEEVYAKIKVRGVVQSLFRQALLKAYKSKCAFCGFPYPEALEASHIIPWNLSTPSEKMSINNGILLCSNHHKLFDRGVLYVSEDLIIGSKQAIPSKIIGKKMRLPISREFIPLKENIKKRNELYNLL